MSSGAIAHARGVAEFPARTVATTMFTPRSALTSGLTLDGSTRMMLRVCPVHSLAQFLDGPSDSPRGRAAEPRAQSAVRGQSPGACG